MPTLVHVHTFSMRYFRMLNQNLFYVASVRFQEFSAAL